ncbi:uncharacterized protein TNCV_2351831 [Trichonephila clavipes]|nr:uncharacterized protein TNCV_2351831 [Trichonephila clavipes]
MHQDLAAFYENPEVPNSFGGVEALHRSVKGKYSKEDVKHWLSQKDAYTLHKPVRHNHDLTFICKKFVLVPEERVQVTEHLSELDQRMKNILHNKDLTEKEKTILYLQVLQKYTYFSNENRRESEPVPNEASLSENQETESLKENLKESVVKTEKEVFEDEIFRIVPARYKEKAKNIFQFLKLQESFSWNSDGEIIYKNCYSRKQYCIPRE